MIFFQEQIDHLLRSQNAVFARVELARFAEYFAQDFVAYRLSGLHFAAPLAGRAWFAHHMRQALAGALVHL